MTSIPALAASGPRRAVLALLALCAAAACPAGLAQSATVTLKLERGLGLHQAPGSARRPTYASADHMQGDVDDKVQLEGSIELRSKGAVLRGDRGEYLCASDQAKVRGDVRLYDRGAVFLGPALDYRLEARTGQMPDASYLYSPREGRGKSSLIEFLGEDQVRMHDATYSNCAPGDDSWWVKAETLDIDRLEQQAIGHHATLYFEGVPVFSSPYFSMPLGDQRRSGILTPSYYYDSRSGFELTVPYYWNMAPNHDLTLTPAIYPRLGVLLGNEFRFLEPGNTGVIDYDVMPYDRATGGKRDHLMLNQTYTNGSGLSAGVNYNRVSDDRFLVDFSHSLFEASPVELPQVEYVTLGRTYWNATLQVARNQTLYSLLNPPGTPQPGSPAPYDRVPDLTLNASRLDWNGFDASAVFDATQFRNSRLEQASRFYVNPSVSYPVLGAGYFLMPKLQIHSTEYNLDPTLHGGQSSASRTLPIASVDAGLVFERNVPWFGRGATQTLEPRLFYTYAPYRDQSRLPNFDSADATFTFAQLFTENSFTGNDRIAEANQLTTAAVSRLIDDDGGAERFRVAVGQRFYFGPERVTLPGEAPRTDLTSDLLLDVSASPSKEWIGEIALEYSAVQSQVVRADVGLRWQPRAASVIDLSYRYQSATLHQIDLAAQWPLTHRWYAVTNLDYSLLGRGGEPGDLSYTSPGRAWVETVLGLEYKADCWVGRLVAQRYSTNGGLSRNTTIFLQVDLNGFTSIGTRSPLDQLRRSIPGYQRINPLPPPAGPYDNYE